MEKYYNYDFVRLLNHIERHNSVENLVCYGRLNRHIESDFGFIKDVVHYETGKNLEYPIINEPIDSVFIWLGDYEANTGERFVSGQYYVFPLRISAERERRKKENPFLLQTIASHEVERISKMDILLKQIEQKRDTIEKELKDKEVTLDIQREEIRLKLESYTQQIEQQLAEREQQANQTIEEYNEAIIALHDKIIDRENESEQLSLEVKQRLSNINQLDTELEKMEATKDVLRQRLIICEKLDFISNQNAQLYLNRIDGKPYQPSQDILDFHKDFSEDFRKLSNYIPKYLYHKKDLLYTEFQIKNFLTLLRTNDLIVLSGLSGSGKTQIVKSIAEAIDGVAKIIPVKPNWMSSDDLLGYYNPLQSTFLPTPFTEAIVEARQNPDRVYLICLDEMNLARVEYYFADFLSRLEERSKQPVIELYASHEEERFISEFQTMLDLLESAVGTQPIHSWKDFLNNDISRKRFFELLGNLEKESMLQIHAQMKRRLIDILKFPSSIEVPSNVRFIGAINIDETTHYFSPKIVDRVHIVRFDNPLLLEKEITNHIGNSESSTPLKPVYVHPKYLGKRTRYPSLQSNPSLAKILSGINKHFLLPLSIDFGVRSMRQALNYASLFVNENEDRDFLIALNAIVIQKILPRFVLSGNDKEVANLKELSEYLKKKLATLDELPLYEVGYLASQYLDAMVEATDNSGQINYWTVNYWSKPRIEQLEKQVVNISADDEDLPF